jgi:hypothetical protein
MTMIKIDYIEPSTSAWKAWRKKCDEETLTLIDSVKKGNSPTINNLYKKAKTFIIRSDSPFHGKCAYCESLIISNQPGDVEHYRPKGKITDSENKVITIKNKKGVDIEHPGYYWLAYCHKNLLPSCIDCNRPYRGNSGGTLVGKWNQFPVKGFRAQKPKELSREEPLIINPCEVDPAIHIEIDETGVLWHTSIEGQTTIEILGLNKRESLVRQRKKTYDDVTNKILAFAVLLVSKKDFVKEKGELEDIKKGIEPYTIAALKAIKDSQRSLSEVLSM